MFVQAIVLIAVAQFVHVATLSSSRCNCDLTPLEEKQGRKIGTLRLPGSSQPLIPEFWNTSLDRDLDLSPLCKRVLTSATDGNVVTSSPDGADKLTSAALPAGVTSCQRELRVALHSWAKEAAKREKSLTHTETSNIEDTQWDFHQSRSAELQLESVQARGDLGHVCSRDWLNGVMARLPSSKIIRASLKRNNITRESLLAGIKSTCDGVREMEIGLIKGAVSADLIGQEDNSGRAVGSSLNSSRGINSGSSSSSSSSSSGDGGDGSARAEWPEACWPIPGVPFNRYSPFSKRRYLVVAAVTEQLSNARSHLVEAARLAKRTGRILVLPKGANSRISLDLHLPICSYWDISRFTPYEWVSPEFYLLTARAALTRPSVGFVWVQSPNMLVRGAFQSGMVGGELLAPLLVHAMGHVPCASNTLDVTMPARSDVVINMLHAWRDKDVIIWLKHGPSRVEFPIPSDSLALRQLPYSPPLHVTAQRILARLPKPLIAVHYRSEWIAYRVARSTSNAQYGQGDAGKAAELMRWCAEQAVRTIEAVQQNSSSTSVYIAADVPSNVAAPSTDGPSSNGPVPGGPSSDVPPIDGPSNTSSISRGVMRSASWAGTIGAYGGMEKEREGLVGAAMQGLQLMRRSIQGTVMIEELLPEASSYDTGMLAILDKLVCAQADFFIGGTVVCGGRRGFERDILQHRALLKNVKQETDLRWGGEDLPLTLQ
ncbi:hypothetical protein CLOM_g4957 [Closterium sp. NIES-68]|nr:hypothetical protein CLOM_g4957 [Closterium sp. NIES-68]GJP85457.1 hypothetical protein CLOP_g15558 [Closterium sp. NIES-67]